MLRRRLILVYLFILFSGIFAQRYGLNVQNKDVEEDDEDDSRPKNLGRPPINNGNSENRLPSGNTGNDGNYQQRNVNQVQRPVGLPRRSPSTQLAASEECQVDIKKYCGKGSQQLISNLKVLQCVDDLDNVSF